MFYYKCDEYYFCTEISSGIHRVTKNSAGEGTVSFFSGTVYNMLGSLRKW